MKLAEALILRADSQKRIEQLKLRLLSNAKVQEGDEPAEEPQKLLAEFEGVTEELTRLMQRINKTNATTELEPGMTLSDALAVRDVLRLKHRVYRDLAQAATVTQGRYSRSEVKFKSAVKVGEVQKQADRLAQEHRELDARIQALNWRVELE
jgi:hypothetical protein